MRSATSPSFRLGAKLLENRKILACPISSIRLYMNIEQGSKTLIFISFTKLNIHLLLERVFLNFSGYSLTVTQMQANATKRLHKFRNRSYFSRDAEQIYEKKCYPHASSVVSTGTPILFPQN
ncbi:hypothetical protein CSKR_106842 [Clonorchis sinensis]|uniref:Uncharacterized protein n=1 Tax=Clonorchis sinensis TaxID=79923 RepID=A0A419PUH8_CLOSI|nr:hypothetical protein CSKR_106842 [Clonorchis sinensis]